MVLMMMILIITLIILMNMIDDDNEDDDDDDIIAWLSFLSSFLTVTQRGLHLVHGKTLFIQPNV